MSVDLVLPGALADLVPGADRRVAVHVTPPATLRDVLDELGRQLPGLERRLRDEQGVLRRHVNVYVDGDDVRTGRGLDHVVDPGAEVLVLPSVAGG